MLYVPRHLPNKLEYKVFTDDEQWYMRDVENSSTYVEKH